MNNLLNEIIKLRGKLKELQERFDNYPNKENAKQLSDCKNVELPNAERELKMVQIREKNAVTISTRNLCRK